MAQDSHQVSDSTSHPAASLQADGRQRLLESVKHRDPLQLSSLEVRRLTRGLRKLKGRADVRIAFAGNVVLEPLAEFVEAQLACGGLLASTYVAPFEQALQVILDPGSELRQFQPDFILLHFEAEALARGLPVSDMHATAESHRAAMDGVFARVEPSILAALENTSAIVLITNFVPPDCYALGLADARSEWSEQELWAQLSSRLGKTYRAEPRVQIVDLSRLTAIHGRSRARDRRLYYVAKLPWHESFLPVLADEITRHVTSVRGRIRKCLIVDLDNTLWGGVLGEEGAEGVRIGSGDPEAEAHFDLQRRILAIKQRGVLLAICSKNNPADVDEVFRLRQDMPLRRDDFVCLEVGWDYKHEGIRRIAERLNIGTDSLVFLDDNPAEVDLVRQLLPEVQCVLVPSDPALRPSCLDRVHGLERAVITAEDQNKTGQYRQNAARESIREQFSSVHGYLQSLQTRITIRTASGELLARAHQLFNKTNQFNVTTHRYALPDLQQVLADSTSRLILVRVEDRFGDSGWVGAVLVRQLDQPHAHIDSFILSCRAMGRGVETAILNYVKHWCFTSTRCTALTAEYRATAKNVPVREFFEQHGFTAAFDGADGAKTYRLAKDECRMTPCDWISCQIEAEETFATPEACRPELPA